MKQFAENHSLVNVYIGERIDKTLIPALLRRCDICLAHFAIRGNNNSYLFDASKNKIIEYMYSNSCIIYGTNVENQFVQTSGAGFTIKPFDSLLFAQTIEKVYKMTSTERLQFGERAKQYVRDNHSVKALTDKYESALL